MSKTTKEILIVESEAVVYAQYKHREEELMIMFNRGATYTYFDVPTACMAWITKSLFSRRICK